MKPEMLEVKYCITPSVGSHRSGIRRVNVSLVLRPAGRECGCCKPCVRSDGSEGLIVHTTLGARDAAGTTRRGSSRPGIEIGIVSHI